MGEGSAYQSVMLTVLVIIACLGIYFVIDNQDHVKVQQKELNDAVNEITGELRRLRTLIDEQGRSDPVTTPDLSAATDPEPAPTHTPLRYANMDLRPAHADEGGRRISYTSALSGNLNYLVNNEAVVGDIWEICNDSLAERHLVDVTRYEPKLAKSWETSEDGLVWTIQLRNNVLWHPYIDPVTKENVPAIPVTADDFVFFWETIQNPKVPADIYRGLLEQCEGITKVDDHTIRVTWKEPYMLIEERTLGFSPLPKHYYRPDPSWDDDRFAEEMISSARNQHMIGCGPYRLVRFGTGTGIILERFEDYYLPKPFIRTRIIKEIKDPEIALNEFRKGNLDSIGLTSEQWEKQSPAPDFYTVAEDPATASQDAAAYAELEEQGKAPTDHKYEKYAYQSMGYSYIGYNLAKPLFQDVRVRRALTMLTNRTRILQEVYKGHGTIIAGPNVPSNPYYDHAVTPLPYDPEQAKALLKEAGWEDTDGDGWLDNDLDGDGTRETFEYTFLQISTSTTQRKYIPIIKADMAKAGIMVNVKPAEWSVYTEILNKKSFDVCSLGWSVPLESDPYQIWHSSQADNERGSNHVSYRSSAADTLIEQGRVTVDKDKRVKLFQKLFRKIHEDQPYTFLFCPTAHVAVQRRYRNVQIYKTGMNMQNAWVPIAEQIGF